MGKNAQRRRTQKEEQRVADGGIREDIVWDEDNPPTVNSCSGNELGHIDECDGNCDPLPLTEMDVKLNNEMRAWARVGMQPLSFPLGTNATGMATNLLDLEIQITAVVAFLVGTSTVAKARLDEIYKEKFFERLNSTRLANEEKIKEARSKQALHVAQRKLLGPNGSPFEK